MSFRGLSAFASLSRQVRKVNVMRFPSTGHLQYVRHCDLDEDEDERIKLALFNQIMLSSFLLSTNALHTLFT